MDKAKKNKKSWRKPVSYLLISICLLGVSYLLYASRSSNELTVKRSILEIARVEKVRFEEGILISGSILPRNQTYLDASEAGVVTTIFAKSGDELEVGDSIVKLSNSKLSLEVLQRESQLMEQLNTQRQTKILLNQNNLNQKQQIEEVKYQLGLQKRRYQRNKKLFEQEVIAVSTFEEIERTFDYLKKREKILLRGYKTDSLARAIQLRQISRSEERLNQNLEAVRAILDKLCVLAPVKGKLSDFDLTQGELIEEGQRLGVLYNLTDPRIEAEVDELYLNQVNEGLKANLLQGDSILSLRLSKVYPGVNEGKFKVKFNLLQDSIKSFFNGQSVRIRLNLDEARQTLVIPKGRFYANTGGQWVYVVENGKAMKRKIKMGQQNDRYYELTNGLKAGEKVIISSYDNFNDYEQLVIQSNE